MSVAGSISFNQLSNYIDDNPATWGDENSQQLLATADALAENKTLARSLSDTGLDSTVRVGIARDLFAKSVSPETLRVIEFAVSQRWSRPSDLIEAIAAAGIGAALAGAESRGQLDQIEDEIFRFARAVAGNGEL